MASGQPLLFCRRPRRPSASGVRSIRWARRLRCVAGSHRWPRPFCRHAVRECTSTPTGPTTCRFPTRMPSMEILEWPLQPGDAVAFDFRVLHGARGMKARRAGALFRSGLFVMMHAISTVRDAHRRRSRDMACDPVIACARTGSQLSFAVRYEMSCVKDGAHA